jgi:hypothetical protein
MLIWLAILAGTARADEYYLEAPPVTDRAAAERMERAADAAGFDARVVRRFRLGKGWEFVMLVEHLASEADAAAAATRLEKELGQRVSAWRLDRGDKAVSVDLPPPPAPAENGAGASAWIARAREAHGGATGGAAALARAAAVHFRFERAFELGGQSFVVRHDYWREGASRRLAVATGGAGQDSVCVATAASAWIKVGSEVRARDIGVAIGTVDAFAPEAVLTVALEAARLLEAPEVASFRPLEGAEEGLRFGTGGDESEPGLSFVDIDPATGRLIQVRYVSEAGPLVFELRGWRDVAPGVLVPAELSVRRPDGGHDLFRVEGLELLDRAPTGTFDKPA